MFALAFGSMNGAEPHGRPNRLAEQLWVERRDRGAVVVLTVRGEVDLGSASLLDEQLRIAQARARPWWWT